MATGANATPLGNIHPSLKGKSHDEKLAAIETAKRVASQLFPQENDPPTKKKRRSRWGSEDVKTILPGLPTVLPSNLTGEHQRMYLSECTGLLFWHDMVSISCGTLHSYMYAFYIHKYIIIPVVILV